MTCGGWRLRRSPGTPARRSAAEARIVDGPAEQLVEQREVVDPLEVRALDQAGGEGVLCALLERGGDRVLRDGDLAEGAVDGLGLQRLAGQRLQLVVHDRLGLGR